MDIKSVKFSLKDSKADENGIFEGYASVYGYTDSDGDVIEKGAFADNVKQMAAGERRPKMCYQHNAGVLIGKWLAMSEDNTGLYVKGQLFINDDPKKEIIKAREAYILMQEKEIDSMSVGFNTVESTQNKTSGRDIQKADLWEISPVTFAANDQATITSVKSIRDFESFLRDAGYSRKQAVAIASHGFRAIDSQGDLDETEAVELMNRLLKSLTITKG